jgi:hypothetical protein
MRNNKSSTFVATNAQMLAPTSAGKSINHKAGSKEATYFDVYRQVHQPQPK